ncbi:MAG TPA: HypC/HybG/HupF family hydrogenase formation chaperone [Thermoplasmatales archaeon]|nr:HypC/HybG/HupF family hydrogenase formation chaperone [Thermoplasmatales archaeon]
MCLAVPAKIMNITDKDHAEIDYGDGVKRTINISLVDVSIGDYVLVHAGFAI